MSAPENPSAFPLPRASAHDDPGMTLRDWFAGQALVALLRQGKWQPAELASHSYRAADALLTERQKGSSHE